MAPRAYTAFGSTIHFLVQISVEEMSSVLKDENMRSVRAIPCYFDANKRVWPTPVDGTPPVEHVPDYA